MGFWQRVLSSVGIMPSMTVLPSPGNGLGGGRSSAGITVTAENAMRVSAFFACLRLVTVAIGSLSLPLYERTDQGNRRAEARAHPLWNVLAVSPNSDQTPVDFLEGLVIALLLAGDSFAIQHRSGDRLISLEPLPPQHVTVERLLSGDRQYKLGSETFSEDRIFHVMGFGGGPLRGLSILGQAREALGLGLGADRSASGMFANGMRPSGAFSLPDFMKNEEQFREVESRLNEDYAGMANHGKPLILEGGMKWESISLNAEDAQLLDSRKFSVEEICRFFGVPPFMIGHSEKSTSWGTGIEQQLIMFQKFTLAPWLKRIEMAIGRQLLMPGERQRYFAEFNVDSLLRADSRARSEHYRTMTQIGAMTINEVRAKENLPPIPGGDVVRIQAQNVPIDAVAGLTGERTEA